MKRLIFGLLVLGCAWKLVQLPSVNSALFAFLTLGINPLTNLPFSTPSLLSILFASGFVALLLLFSRAISDFLGGLVDWLTRADGSLNTAIEPQPEPVPIMLASLPVQATVEELAEPAAASAIFMEFIARVRAISLPAVRLPGLPPYAAVLSKCYRSLIQQANARLQALKQAKSKTQTPASVDSPQAPQTELAPELAEIVAIFEKLVMEAEQAEPSEAVVVAPERSTKPSVAWVSFKRHIVVLKNSLDRIWHGAIRAAAVSTGLVITAAERRAGVMTRTTRTAVTLAARATYRFGYRGMLLAALGALMAGSTLLHFLYTSSRVTIRMSVFAYRRVCHFFVLCAVTITLGMFAVGRAVSDSIQAIGRALAALCRGVYRILSLGAMLIFLGAGYMLFAFSLICFMAWEVFEPYARRADKWLGATVDDREGLSELTKMGREMTRTFAQWYHQLRDIKHSIYH